MFTPDFLSRVEFALQFDNDQKHSLNGRIYTTGFHILLLARQQIAQTIKRGINPEDETEYIRQFESANMAIARYLGLAPEQPKDEDDKPGKMKCVKCELITNENPCPDCGGTEFRVMQPGEMGWL